MAKDHKVRKERRAGTQISQALSVPGAGGGRGRGIWEIGLPLEFSVELLCKSLAPRIYKTTVRTTKEQVPHSKRTASGEYDTLLEAWVAGLNFWLFLATWALK